MRSFVLDTESTRPRWFQHRSNGHARTWEAAQDTWLNQNQWADATGATLNLDLQNHLQNLWKRCSLEFKRNPTLAGIVNTHINDIVGVEGPTLQVQSDLDSFNSAVEAVWADIWEMPDINGQLHGSDWLRLAVRDLWRSGDALTQLVDGSDEANEPDPDDQRPLKTRVLSIRPQRLETPAIMRESWTDQKGRTIFSGIKRTRLGRPLEYYLRSEDIAGTILSVSDYAVVPASEMLHAFLVEEANQVRGVPWASIALQIGADMRDYDAEVLEAARGAATQGVLLKSNSPDVQFLEIDEEVDVPRRKMTTLPNGYDAFQIRAEQPAANYIDYRAERQRDMGRPMGMPPMMVRLDSQKHNYSSARFDGQIYWKGVTILQGWIARVKLQRLVRRLINEAQMRLAASAASLPESYGGLRTAPERWRLFWTWPAPPHVDPLKESQAIDVRLRNGTMTVQDAVRAYGGNPDTHLERLARELGEHQTAGVPHPLTMQSASASPADDTEESEESEGEGEEEDRQLAIVGAHNA